MACIVGILVFVLLLCIFVSITKVFESTPALPPNPVLPTQVNPYAIDSDLGPEHYEVEQDDGTTVKHYRGSKEYYTIWNAIN